MTEAAHIAKREPTPAKQWAAIAIGSRNEWVMSHTVRRTKREARAAYLAVWDPAYHREALKRVRLSRVRVSEIQE